MIQENADSISVLDELIKKNKSFALWRTPGEEVRFIMQNSSKPSVLFHNYKDISNENETFIIAPFHITPHTPIISIRSDIKELPTFKEVTLYPVSQHLESNAKIINSAFQSYELTFDKFMKALLGKEFDKLVLSRMKCIERKDDFSATTTFFKALKTYPDAFVYLCNSPVCGTWIGSSPEILLSGGKNNNWQTVALAGTQSIQNGTLPTEWDDKNKREQRLVADYIKRQLSSLNICAQESKVYTAQAGALAHLKSDFTFKESSSFAIGNLIDKLHPTPAICGLPKEKALQFILENEDYNRDYYAGFIGYMDKNIGTDLYVNLRCMQLTSQYIRLFAGGGLLSSSNVNSEWEETEAKMLTMKRLIHKDEIEIML